MAKKNPATTTSKKHGMVKVKCPKNGGAETWANIGPKKGPVCTGCGGTGHDIVPSK